MIIITYIDIYFKFKIICFNLIYYHQSHQESHDQESHDQESHDQESHDEGFQDEESHDEESHDEESDIDRTSILISILQKSFHISQKLPKSLLESNVKFSHISWDISSNISWVCVISKLEKVSKL